MKLAKLLAYLGICVFIPLWLFILMDNKLEKEYEGKSLFDRFNALLKVQKDKRQTNPETSTTINQPFIQFTYGPQTIRLLNPSYKSGMPVSFPETIKIDPQSFSGVVDELKSLKEKVSSDIQSINSSLTVLNGNPNARNISNKDNSNVFRYEFSEKDIPTWIVTRNNNDSTTILILKNKSKAYNAQLKIDTVQLNLIGENQIDTVTLEPNEEIALLCVFHLNRNGVKEYFIKVNFDTNDSLVPSKRYKTIEVIVKN